MNILVNVMVCCSCDVTGVDVLVCIKEHVFILQDENCTEHSKSVKAHFWKIKFLLILTSLPLQFSLTAPK